MRLSPARLLVGALAIFGLLLVVTHDPKALNHQQNPTNSSPISKGSETIPGPERLLLPRPYLFIHVPKSGGTAVGKVAEKVENSGGDERFIRYWHHPVRPEVINEMLQHDFIFGHFKYGLHEHFNRTCTYLTILRNPIDRVISHYYYHLKSEGDRLHHLAASNPIEKWVELSIDANNDQVQFISGKHGIPGEDEFQLAMSNIKSFGFVGIYERFDETMVLLRHYAGFQDILSNHTKSVLGRPKAEELSPSVIKKIKEHNLYDFALYEEGVRIFEEQIKRVGPSFEEELRNFRLDQQAYAKKLNNSCVECFDLKKPGGENV